MHPRVERVDVCAPVSARHSEQQTHCGTITAPLSRATEGQGSAVPGTRARNLLIGYGPLGHDVDDGRGAPRLLHVGRLGDGQLDLRTIPR